MGHCHRWRNPDKRWKNNCGMRPLTPSCYVMFGFVIISGARVAHAGASQHTKNTAELSPFVSSDRQSLFHVVHKHAFFDDSKHDADACVGTLQSRTNVRLGMTSQQLLLQAQLRIRSTCCHIFIHGGNVGNACSDHGARSWSVVLFVQPQLPAHAGRTHLSTKQILSESATTLLTFSKVHPMVDDSTHQRNKHVL